MNVVKNYLRYNPEFAANLKEGVEDELINTLAKNFEERQLNGQPHLVNKSTNLAVDVGDVIKSNARPFLKSWGNGRYIPKYNGDSREDHQKNHKPRRAEPYSKIGLKGEG